MKLRRKDLRRKSTKEELKLWSFLRNKGLGYKFFRQYSVGNYVIDSYCPTVRLAIELDGERHNNKNAKLYDAYRSEYFKAFGIRVFRFWNQEVIGDIDKVVERIKKELDREGG